MKVLLTGSDGFLGWHTRVRLRALTENEVVAVGRGNWSDLDRLAKDVDAVIHCAGVNRASPEEVEFGNIDLATAVADAVVQGGLRPRIVYANSIQCGSDSPYGRGKCKAGEILAAAAWDTGGTFTDVQLPNLFGENGRPNYNSFVATFIDAVLDGKQPSIQDRDVILLHAQSAAQSLMDGLLTAPDRIDPGGVPTSVRAVLELLQDFRSTYESGDIPSLATQFDLDLFNALRSRMFPRNYPILLTAHSDDRGQLVETVRSHGGQGQTFISTTRPGVTRGEHFHLGKIERFVVISGTARIRLRRIFANDIITFDINGEVPAAIDMPTMWAHNVTNTGPDELTMMFWTDKLFDPTAPDTYAEPVGLEQSS